MRQRFCLPTIVLLDFPPQKKCGAYNKKRSASLNVMFLWLIQTDNMARFKRHKYKINPYTLAYEKVRISFKERLKEVSFGVAFGIVVAVILTIVSYYTIDSPKEKNLKREIAQYKYQIELLNKRTEQMAEVLEDIENRDDNIYRTIFEAEPISANIRNSGIGGVERYNNLKGYDNSAAIINLTKKVDDLSKRLYIQSKSFDEVYEMAKNKNERLNAIPAIMPLSKKTSRIVSGFGMRFHPILHYRRMHTGIDLVAKKGTPVYTTGDGTIEIAGKGGSQYSGYGIVVVVNHGFGYKTLYAHLSKVDVKNGQKVKRGEKIGEVGSTGLSQAPHLHYEVIQNGKKVNPVYYFFNDLTVEEYEQVIDEANAENQCLS